MPASDHPTDEREPDGEGTAHTGTAVGGGLYGGANNLPAPRNELGTGPTTGGTRMPTSDHPDDAHQHAIKATAQAAERMTSALERIEEQQEELQRTKQWVSNQSNATRTLDELTGTVDDLAINVLDQLDAVWTEIRVIAQTVHDLRAHE